MQGGYVSHASWIYKISIEIKEAERRLKSGTMYVTWHGTATREAGCAAGRLLFDPFVPLAGTKSCVTIGDFDGFTHILVTHGHFDHISCIPAVVRRNPSARVYCTQTPLKTLHKKGVPWKSLILICPGQILHINGFAVHVFAGRHARLPWFSPVRAIHALKSPFRYNLPYIFKEHLICREHDETVFYHLEAENKSISVMGSLNLRDDVEYPSEADLLVLPYNGWAENFLPAVKSITRLKPKRVVLDHYDDTFPPISMTPDLLPLLNRYGSMVSAMEQGRPEYAL